MRLIKSAIAVATTVLFCTAAHAGGHDITDQTYKGGKAGAASAIDANPLANCPIDQRGIYRGNLYCRQPLLAVIAPRHSACPPEVKGLYRGNIYCVAGQN